MKTQEKAQRVECFIQTQSDIEVQRRFITRYNRHPPSTIYIRA